MNAPTRPTQAKQAIATRFIGPSNTKPSRIKATCDRGAITISMPIEESGADAHAVAVRALLAKFAKEDGAVRSWPAFERWVCGGMPQASKDAYVWVQLPAPDASPEPPAERRLRDALAEILIAGGSNGADVQALLKIAADALREAGKDFARANPHAARPNLYELHEQAARAAIAKATGGAA